ncbi:MCP four helix bundle domain-containing protein [Psychroserpens sp. XS_ASV72]|uniref:MCP four helix bundle domain-containing protein n=1 Tax=Psychroserpens sp. XS_ASV72 TaxID=3241293 RepID=UPI0035127402
MSKKNSFSNRINIGFALLVVFLLVFATNRIDKRHFETVQDTLTTVYEDRVVAQDYVYKMNNIMHQKQLQLKDSSKTDNQNNLNKEFATLIDVFSTTKLTPQESKTFEDLKKNFETLKTNESKDNTKMLASNINAIKTDLNNLALIQLTESKYKVGIAQKSLDTNNLMSTLEMVFLVLIGFIVQFALFYRVKKAMTTEVESN